MRTRVSGLGFATACLLLLLLSPSVYSRYYYYEESESGWNTGLRESITLSMDISGLSMGQGSYSHYGEIGLDDVRIRDRTSSANGTLVYREGMHIISDANEDEVFDAVKPSGTQNYYITVNETWPVHVDSYRSLDFSGRRINDLEYFGNNFEYAGSSVLYATELRKDTSAALVLKGLYFNAIINDTLNSLLLDEFTPNLTLNVDQRSSFKGLATFRFRHSLNRKPVSEGEERYWGDFTIVRNIDSAFTNSTCLNEPDVLECCVNPCDHGGYSLLISPEVRTWQSSI